MSVVGDRIKEIRIARGLSQDELANKVEYNSRVSISMIETGDSKPSLEALVKIASALSVSPSYLLGVDDGKEQALEDAFNKRPEMRALFSVAEKASKEDIETTIKIIEALQNK